MTDINLTDPVTITLQPTEVRDIIQALGEAPYRVARPLIDSIIAQIQRQQVDPPELKAVER